MHNITFDEFNKLDFKLYENNPIIKTFHSSVLPQKRLFNTHHHTECELSFFLKGSGIYRLQNKQYPFHAGDVFLFGSNDVVLLYAKEHLGYA